MFKCELEIWIVYCRYGMTICPDIRRVTVPMPLTFYNGKWTTDRHPLRSYEA